MSAKGQNAKYSVQADVSRFASKLRQCSMQSALRICANSDISMLFNRLAGSRNHDRRERIYAKNLPRNSLASCSKGDRGRSTAGDEAK